MICLFDTLMQTPVFLADTSLRFIVRMSQAAVVFTVFDDLLLRWLESTSDVWAVSKVGNQLVEVLLLN